MNKERVEGFMFGVSIGFLVAHLLKPLLYLNNARLGLAPKDATRIVAPPTSEQGAVEA